MRHLRTFLLATIIWTQNAEATPVSSSSLTPSMFSSGCTGAVDDSCILKAAVEAAVANHRALTIDRSYSIADSFMFSASGLILRGDGDPNKALIYTGSREGFEFTGAVDIDGVTFDCGMAAGTSRAFGNTHACVGIHGPMTSSPSYLDGVKIRYMRVQNSLGPGLVLANLVNLRAERLDVDTIYNQAVIFTGIKNGVIGHTTARNVGDLKPTGHRRASILINAETKQVANWYVATNALPMSGTHFGDMSVQRSTDTCFYVNNDLSKGVDGNTWGDITVDTCGKDGIKWRSSGERIRSVRAGVLKARNIGNSGVVIDHVQGFSAASVEVENVGFDSVGAITGTPSTYTGGDAGLQTISTNPLGFIVQSSDGVTVSKGVTIRNVHSNPVSYSQGQGVSIISSTHVSLGRILTDATDSQAVRSGASSDITFDVEAKDALRIALNLDGTQPTAWNPSAHYVSGQVCTEGGFTYRAVAVNRNVEPSRDVAGTTWLKIYNKVALLWNRDIAKWSPNKHYQTGDATVSTTNQNSYRAFVENTDTAPESNPKFWQLINGVGARATVHIKYVETSEASVLDDLFEVNGFADHLTIVPIARLIASPDVASEHR